MVTKFETVEYGVMEWDQVAKEVYFVAGDCLAPVDRFGEFVHPMWSWRFRIVSCGGKPWLERVKWEKVTTS